MYLLPAGLVQGMDIPRIKLPRMTATRGLSLFDRKPGPKPIPSGKLLPVIETFGPTIQGEGPEAGLTCCFVRFGGCDYLCSWCDSMFAVDPALVRQAEKLTVEQIIERLPPTSRVILSGGNPALLNLGELIDALHAQRRTVSVETQGSVWRPWLGKVDKLIISPKPPSSGMVSTRHDAQTATFMDEVEASDVDAYLKIVVFHDEDYEWAKRFAKRHGWRWPLYLSAGTPQPTSEGEPMLDKFETEQAVLRMVLDNFRWLCERVMNDPDMGGVKVLPQLHVIAWGTARGV